MSGHLEKPPIASKGYVVGGADLNAAYVVDERSRFAWVAGAFH